MSKRRRRVKRRAVVVKAAKVRRVRRAKRVKRASPLVVLGQGSYKRRYSGRGGFNMRRKRRRSGKRSGGFLRGGGGVLGGFLSKPVMFTVAGAAVAAFAGPQISRFIPASWGGSTVGRLGAGFAVGALGYLLLKRFSREAAAGFAAASIVPSVIAALSPAPKAAGVSGYGDGAEGVSYLPALEGLRGDDDMQGLDDDMQGLGAVDPDFAEV